MLINWFTVIAQIVNFSILVFLLKYFLYDRVIRVMDQREQKIQQRLQEAEEKKQEAQREAEVFRAKNSDFNEKRQEMLSQAKEEVETRRRELTTEARQSVTKQRSMWLETIQRDKKSFIQDLRRMAGSQVYTIARKAFRDLADVGVEECTIEVFLAQVRGMTKRKQERLAASIREGGNEVVIRSAFEISAKMREKITGSLHQEIADGIQVRYEPASDLIMGIELKTRGRKIAWSLQGYLDNLEEYALQALDTELKRKSARASAEQGGKPKGGQPPATKRADPKKVNRKQSNETDEITA